MFIFTDNTILLTIKSSTTEIPYSFKETTDTVINDLVLPAPPSQNEITEDSVKQLIIPDPESKSYVYVIVIRNMGKRDFPDTYIY